MTTRDAVLCQVGRLALVPRPAETDRQLLRRYTVDGAQDAFAALLRRHAGMVLGVCRRALPTSQDAEDACQTTFLILARKASGRWQESVANWLFATARRVARDARRAAERRARRERLAAVPEAVPPIDHLTARELLAAVDEELDRLPPHYREPLVLYHLEDLTRDEIAGRMGVPAGTVKIRLERGRKQLHAALARRGLALGVGLVTLVAPAGAVTPRTIGAILAAVAGPPPAAVAALARRIAVNGSAKKTMAVAAAVAAVVTLGAAMLAAWPEAVSALPTPPPATAGAADGPRDGVDALGDTLPAGALLRVGTFRLRDGGGTNQAVLSPDSKTIATASEAGITLFDLATGHRRLWIADSGVPNGYSPNKSRFAFAPDGKTLFTLSDSHAIIAYDLDAGKKLASFPVARPAGNPNRGSDTGYTRLWMPAGARHLVAARADKTVLLDPDTGKEVRVLDFAALAAETSPGGLRLFTIAKDHQSVAVFDAAGKPVRTLEHTTAVELLGFDPAGTTLAAVGPESKVRVWDLPTGRVLADVSVPEKVDRATAVTALAIAPDRKTVLAGTKKGAIYRIELATGKELAVLRGHPGSLNWVNGLFFPDGGKTLVSIGWDHRVARWDLATGRLLPDSGGYVGYLHLDRSPDGTLLAAADATGLIELLDGTTGRRVRTLQEAGRSFATRVTFAPDGRTLATAHQDARVRIWDPAAGRLVREIEVAPAPKDRGPWFAGLAFTPDGRTLVASTDRVGVFAFDPATGNRLWSDSAGSGALAFLPGGRTLVSGGWDTQLHFREAATGKVRASTPAKHFVVDDIAASPDGRLLATCHHNGMVCLRDPVTGAIQKEWQAHTPGQVAWGVSFGPGGIWLASAGDRTVAVWDAATGTLLRRFEGHTSRAYMARFAPDGRTVLSSSLDLTGYVWDVRPKIAPADARPAAQLWDDLAGDPAAAFRAVWAAAADPKAVATLGEKLPAPAKPDPARFQKLTGQLADPDFQAREAAEQEMAGLGPAALALARKAREGTDSAEARLRLDRVIRGWTRGPFTPENWRQRRAVVAMQLAGTPAARELLKRWATDAPGTVLSDAAAEALARLDRLDPPAPR